MKLEFALLADAAQVVDGKLYVLGGGWNSLRCSSFPWPANPFLAVSVLMTKKDSGKPFPMTVTISNAKGVPIIPAAQGQFEVGVPEDTTESRALFAIQTSMVIPEAGTYAVVVNVREETITINFDAVFVGKRIELG